MSHANINSYYDLDEILAGDERVPVIFQHSGDDLGWMDEQSMDEQHLPENSRIEMPWWMASQLAGRNTVALDLPRMLQPQYKERIMAQPEVIDLQSRDPFFYEFGIMYADLIRDQDLDIGGMLCRVMEARYKEIVKRTVNRKQSESQDFVARLCNMERQLHEAKAAGLLQYTKFANRSAIQLTIAPVLATLPSFAPHLQRSSSISRANAHQNASSSSSSNANDRNALRNITNGRNAGASSSSSSNRGVPPTQPLKASAAATSQSTLAQLTAINAANVPLATHQRKKYGMAATQAREQQQQAQNTQRAADAAAAATQAAIPQAQSQRKRKNTQQNQ